MSNASSSSYPISHSTGRCAATGDAFSEGQPIVAALVQRDGQFVRLDYTSAAWRSGVRPAALFASWATAHRIAEPARRLALSDDEAEELFESLSQEADSGRAAFRALLALYLVRRKVLVYEGTVGGLMRLRRRTRASEPAAPLVTVPEVSLNDAQASQAMDQLRELIPDQEPGA